MKIYFAGGESHYPLIVQASLRANVLFSYYSLGAKDPSFIKLDGRSFFLDSGAFSAFTLGITVNIHEYIEFIKRTKNIWTVINGLDVIGNWKASAENMKVFEAEGITPLPTFHTGSPLEELKRLCENYDYIALGGLVPYATKGKIIRDWLDTCFSVIKNYWPKKIHGFGVNSFKLWLEYPFYSVDATSWMIYSQRLAQVHIFEKGRIKKYPGLGRNGRDDGDLIKNNNPMLAVKYKDDGTTSNYIERSKRQIQELLKAGDYVTEVWKERGIVFND